MAVVWSFCVRAYTLRPMFKSACRRNTEAMRLIVINTETIRFKFFNFFPSVFGSSFYGFTNTRRYGRDPTGGCSMTHRPLMRVRSVQVIRPALLRLNGNVPDEAQVYLFR